ncbi:hypothetical protein QQ045_017638 [Rhodiola kirilowii]
MLESSSVPCINFTFSEAISATHHLIGGGSGSGSGSGSPSMLDPNLAVYKEPRKHRQGSEQNTMTRYQFFTQTYISIFYNIIIRVDKQDHKLVPILMFPSEF